MLFGSVRLPVYLIWEYALPYTEVELALTKEQAARTAFSRMRGELAAALAGAEVLRESFTGEFLEEGYTLTCEAECIVDITAPLSYQSEFPGG